ncbi:hypothetical protein [Microbacterium sp. JZ31]|uniref:hypothetical protein n=1 Tax=Microbacterium sp. JZ31 TaxID=1906274 RepID=UPI001EE4DE95|nr:hypothetical protein [Microbacterium sp. JZ31]
MYMSAPPVPVTIVEIADTSSCSAALRTPTVTTRPIAAPGSPPSPNGTRMAGRKPATSCSGVPTMLEATPMITEMRIMTPNVGQKRPRVSTHERAIARNGPVCSSTMAAGTRKSLVPSHAHSGKSRIRAGIAIASSPHCSVAPATKKGTATTTATTSHTSSCSAK